MGNPPLILKPYSWHPLKSVEVVGLFHVVRGLSLFIRFCLPQKRGKRDRIAFMVFNPEVSHCKSDQNFDCSIWNQHHANGSRESIILPALDEVQSYSVESNLNQYKIPQNALGDFAFQPALYFIDVLLNQTK